MITLKSSFMAELCHESFGNAVHTAYGRHHPYLVAYTYIAILAYIALKGAVLILNAQFLAYGIVCVLKRS